MVWLISTTTSLTALVRCAAKATSAHVSRELGYHLHWHWLAYNTCRCQHVDSLQHGVVRLLLLLLLLLVQGRLGGSCGHVWWQLGRCRL